MDTYESQLAEIKKKSKFTLPTRLYIDNDYNIIRRKIVMLIADLLEAYEEFKMKPKEEQVNIILNIELSCFNSTIKKSNEVPIYINWDNSKFSYLYQLFCNKITKNMDCKSEVGESYLIKKIINNEIDITTIAELPSDKLCPMKSEDIKEKLNMRNQQKLDYKTSTLYTCRNCGKRRTILKEFQARSLDEGTNLSLTCTFCQYHWVT